MQRNRDAIEGRNQVAVVAGDIGCHLVDVRVGGVRALTAGYFIALKNIAVSSGKFAGI